MKKLTKRLSSATKQIIKESYDSSTAITLAKKLATAKFTESMEAHIWLNLDPKQANQNLRTTVMLPNGTGKEIKIAVLAAIDKHPECLEAGANIVGENDLFDEINKGQINFDILLTTPDMMPKLTKLGKVLGPRKLMPSAKAGTVVTDLGKAVQSFKTGKTECRLDKNGIVHMVFGNAKYSEEQLLENLLVIFNTIKQNKPSGIKNNYVNSIYICSTMGPSIKINLNSTPL